MPRTVGRKVGVGMEVMVGVLEIWCVTGMLGNTVFIDYVYFNIKYESSGSLNLTERGLL